MESNYSPAQIQTATAKVLNLFAEIKEEYGALFDNKEHRYTPAKAREWAVELLESGINSDQYQHGRYQAIKRQKYPVERSYDFIELCKSLSVNEYPDMKAAYLQAAQGEYKHEVILETAKRVGTWELKTQPESVSYKSWQQHYPIVCEENSNGASFKVPVSRQVEYEHTPVQPNTAFASTIDDFLRMNGSKAKTL